MKAKALGRLLTAGLLSSAVVFVSITGKAQIPTPTANWVNIKDPKFGAIGNGSHDDTAAIQAAIDYAFANNLSAVYCPAGYYKISNTIYLDPPGNLRSNLSNPTMFGFSMAFFGDPSDAGGEGNGNLCRLNPTNNNFIAFLVGTGQGMRVSDIAVIGPSGAYRGQQPNTGVGIGLAGGSGGSSNNLVENTYVDNFYTLYMTNANGAFGLNDSNTFRKVAGSNGYSCILIASSQNYINDVIEPRLSCTVGIDDQIAKPVTVVGGNISANGSATQAFAISGTSALSGNPNDWYTFTTTIAAPDTYINTVYDSYEIMTAHFGLIPLVLTAWDSFKNVATFSPWGSNFADFSYGTINLVTNTDLSAEIQAATTVYATERVRVFRGLGIHAIGTHIETDTCTTLVDAYTSAGGSVVDEIDNPFFNYDPGETGAAAFTGGTLGRFYCQEVWPFIDYPQNVPNGNILLKGGDYDQRIGSAPVVMMGRTTSPISGEKLQNLALFNYIFDNAGSDTYQQVGGNYAYETVGRGGGRWDRDYLIPSNWTGEQHNWLISGELTNPFCGYEPCPWTTPSLSPALYSLVSGSLGALGSYPPIACRTVFRSVDWNSEAITPPSSVGGGIFLRSASCPGYSWGQNLTDATVGETVTWSYKGQSDKLYLDTKTLGWMFPGLGISLNNGSGAVNYIVTGVYPQLGYISVMKAASNAGAPLVGTKTTVYSCSSGCSILQAPFSWTAY